MIDIKLLDPKSSSSSVFFEKYRKDLEARSFPVEKLDELVQLNLKRKDLTTRSETAKSKQNQISGQIPAKKKLGENVDALMADLKILAQEVKELESQTADIDLAVQNLAALFPNKLHESTPYGTSAESNKMVKQLGTPRTFSFSPRQHFELGEALGILDFDRATKVTGARFTFMKGAASRLERALIQFFLDTHTLKNGYTEVNPPYIVNSASYFGTGQFPKFKEDVFALQGTDYYLISTAEVPLTNLYREEILEEEALPQKFCAFSPCFRSEAGAAGRDTRGLIRQHQFHKVELMTFAHPSRSYEELENLTTHAEGILESLELPYRRMALCSGDIGFGSAKTYDLEVWMPGAGVYREISSCSNFEDFQARRANIRYRPKGGGKPLFLHTLNGSGLAVGRTLVAILENYQTEEGGIKIPSALHKYFDGQKLIEPPGKNK